MQSVLETKRNKHIWQQKQQSVTLLFVTRTEKNHLRKISLRAANYVFWVWHHLTLSKLFTAPACKQTETKLLIILTQLMIPIRTFVHVGLFSRMNANRRLRLTKASEWISTDRLINAQRPRTWQELLQMRKWYCSRDLVCVDSYLRTRW